MPITRPFTHSSNELVPRVTPFRELIRSLRSPAAFGAVCDLTVDHSWVRTIQRKRRIQTDGVALRQLDGLHPHTKASATFFLDPVGHYDL